MHGMPRGRWPPLLLGIHTRRRGLGTYFPELSSSHSVSSQRSRPWVSIRSNVSLSTPDAPAFATTAIGFKQDVLATDLVPKGVEAEGWFSLSFRLQRGLQLLNRFRR